MFYKAFLQEKKRALIHAHICQINIARENLRVVENKGEKHAQLKKINTWERNIRSFNEQTKYGPYFDERSLSPSFLDSNIPELQAESKTFYKTIDKYLRFNNLTYIMLGLLLILAPSIICIAAGLESFLLVCYAAQLTAIIACAIYTGITKSSERMTIGKAFNHDELESYFSGSKFDRLIAHLSTFTLNFTEHYPAEKFRNILMGISGTENTINFGSAEIDKLTTEYLNHLSDALPNITTLYIDILIINKMSNEQLDALAKITPNVLTVISTCDTGENPLTKIQYLESQFEMMAQKKSLGTIFILSQLEKGRPSKKGEQRYKDYPADIVNYTAEFFPSSNAIKKGLEVLRPKLSMNMSC